MEGKTFEEMTAPIEEDNPVPDESEIDRLKTELEDLQKEEKWLDDMITHVDE